MRNLLYFIVAFILFSCQESEQHRIARLTEEWTGKPIYYPVDSVFESFENDSIRKYSLKRTEYAIVTYADSTKCTHGVLKLEEWKEFLADFKTVAKGKATCLFFLHPENKDKMMHTLQAMDFNFPVCIDEEDIFNTLNHFPADSLFQTFLVDKDNKILAVGNPAEDPKVKELYLKIIANRSM